ncbi:MAG TPA: TolC family protein [Ignavibacteriaceae bacterium]|nr:TolC family protein [Ignavibacteriaceae bacterium]
MKNSVKILIINLLTGFALNVAAQNPVLQLSLDDACKLAIDSNLQIINARIEIQKNHYQELEAKSKFYPTVEGYSDFNYYYAIPQMLFPGEFFGETGEIPIEIGTKYDWSSGFKSSMPLVNLSKLTAIKLAKSMKAMSSLSLEQKKEEILYQVHQVYYLCQATNAQIIYLDKNMGNTQHLLEILNSQISNGIARRIDYSKLTVTKNNLQTQIDNLEKLKVQQSNMLKFILGLNNDAQLVLTDSLTEQVEVPNDTPLDLSQRTDIKLIENQIENTKLNKKSVSKSYLPTLSAVGQFYYQGQQNEFNYFNGKDRFFKVGYVGLSLSVPIFNGFEKQHKIQQYNLEIAQLQNTKKNTANNLRKDYANAIEEYRNSLKIIHRQQENIKVAEDNYNISLQQYKQQTLLLSDLILAENSLTEARLSYTDALLQLKNAELELKKLNNEFTK